MKIRDLDCVFISYDEPNAEENYQHLLKLCPSAQRVSNVSGYDRAHKAAAQIATTENFVIIDGDCRVRTDFFEQELEFNDGVNIADSVISWPSYNPVNGLAYGNGGIKCWPRQLLLTQQTHEAGSGIDFDYTRYLQMNRIGGDTIINTTPRQAWRAGFREGIKLRLEGGKFLCGAHPDKDNRKRLWNWQHVGSDVENGCWAMAGARHSVQLAESGWSIEQLNDLTELNRLFDPGTLLDLLDDELDPDESVKFKSTFVNPPRSGEEFLRSVTAPDYDIVFISYDEVDADERYLRLKARFPKLRRVHGVRGIHAAHCAAAMIVQTPLFWVVDGDAEIVDDFRFDFRAPQHDQECVRVWRAMNPVNGLEYGYGGVKLLPRQATLDVNLNSADMTTSISSDYRPMNRVSNTTSFATDEWSAWRGAFRETAKLASRCISGHDDETSRRLHTWRTVASGQWAKYVLAGAHSGSIFGEMLKDRPNELGALINDFTKLRNRFNYEFSEYPV